MDAFKVAIDKLLNTVKFEHAYFEFLVISH